MILALLAQAAPAAAEEPATTKVAIDLSSGDAEELGLRPQRLPANLPHSIYYYNTNSGEQGGVAGNQLPVGADDPVYSNMPPEELFVTPGLKRLIGDDIRTVALGGCNVTGYELKFARANKGCSITGYACETAEDCFEGETCDDHTDPGFEATFALYDGCPNSGGTLIPGTEGFVSFAEDGTYTVVVDFSDTPIFIDRLLWVGVEFDRDGAGWVVGTPAQTGFSENKYDFPNPFFWCRARFAGSPVYAANHVRIFCYDDPEDPIIREFLSYTNPELTGLTLQHPNGPNNWLVDDIRPIVQDCKLTSFEVGAIGFTPFTVTAEIWRQCNPGTLIPGTTGTFEAFGDGSPELARFEFPEGILIEDEDELHVAFKFSTADAAGIIADRPTLGFTDFTFGIFGWDGQPEGCIWTFGTQFVGFAINVSCEGRAPLGACCDLSQVIVGGDPTCRQVTELGCQGSLTRFSQGMGCPLTCSTDGTTCETDLDCEPMVCSGSLDTCSVTGDCPDGETCEPQVCVDVGESFEPACGMSGCCTPPNSPFGETCVDMFEEDCIVMQDTDGNPAIWNIGTQCETDTTGLWTCNNGLPCDPANGDNDCPGLQICSPPDVFECTRWLCRFAEGDCAVPHGDVGCNVPSCCDHICDQDGWCCEVEWDQACVDRVNDPEFGCIFECFDPCGCHDTCDCAREVDVSVGICAGGDNTCDWQNGNDDCPGLEVCNRPSVKINTEPATLEDGETFCCAEIPGGNPGSGSVWVKFVPASTAMKISVDDGGGPGDAIDSVMQVWKSTAPDGSCESAIPIACDDDSGDGNQAELTLYGLDQSATYYIQLAGKGTNEGQYKIDFDWPVGGESFAPVNDKCDAATVVAAAGTYPYDLFAATYDCPWETCLPSSDPTDPTVMDRDVWFSYFAIGTGVVTVSTCGSDDTSIVVYSTGTCPPEPIDRIACNNDGPEGCSPGSQTNFTAEGGQLYLVRVGGNEGSQHSGMVTFSDITVDCQPNAIPDHEDISSGNSYDLNTNAIPDECEDCNLALYPSDTIIDARQPSSLDGTTLYGWSTWQLGNAADCEAIGFAAPDQFAVSSLTGPAPTVDSVDLNDPVTVILSEPISTGAWTEFYYDVYEESICVGYLPGDVNANRLTNGFDIRTLIDVLEGNQTLGIHSTDIDRNDVTEVDDILRLVDLLNGADEFAPWYAETLVDTLCLDIDP
ncbi:MAG: hypothetical protein ACYTHJ_13730 [Planctomycetota bacterium]